MDEEDRPYEPLDRHDRYTWHSFRWDAGCRVKTNLSSPIRLFHRLCLGELQTINTLLPLQGNAMLVLSRKKDEKIIIGDSITVMVIEIRGDKVRLGIEAPKEITVHRQEVYDAIKREQVEKRDISIDAP